MQLQPGVQADQQYSSQLVQQERLDNHEFPGQLQIRTQGTDLQDQRTSGCNQTERQDWSESGYKQGFPYAQ